MRLEGHVTHQNHQNTEFCRQMYVFLSKHAPATLRGEFGRAWKTSVTLSNVVLEIRDSRSSFRSMNFFFFFFFFVVVVVVVVAVVVAVAEVEFE